MADYDKAKSDQLVEWARWVGQGGGRILDLANQLEAAGREVARIVDLKTAIGYEIEKRDALTIERDSLRAEVDRMRVAAKLLPDADRLEAAIPTPADYEPDCDPIAPSLMRDQDLVEWEECAREIWVDSRRGMIECIAHAKALTATLRAIWPVYLAAREWRHMVTLLEMTVGRIDNRFTKPAHDLASAVDAARAALTTDILAALKAAGLELP